jgi:hypothetical protein
MRYLRTVEVRRVILAPSVIAVGIAVAIGASDALAGTTPAPAAQQTHPRVRPRAGHRYTRFELSFTLAQAPGQAGFVETEYRPVVTRPAHTRARCTPPQPAPVVSGTPGTVRRIALHRPKHGWCQGRYQVTVWLQQTDNCGPPREAMTQTAIVCPLEPAFAPEQLNTGEAHFTVRWR